jgi:uncharacterized cupin superfamily protein
MSQINFEDVLKVRPHANRIDKPDGGVIIEVVRGGDSLTRRLGIVDQNNIAVIVPGGVTGNHVHQVKYEMIYIYTGELTVYLQDVETGERYSQLVREGHLFDLPPRIAHALQNTGTGNCTLIEYANLRFRKDDGDVKRHKIIEDGRGP